LLPPYFGEACFAARDHSLHIQEAGLAAFSFTLARRAATSKLAQAAPLRFGIEVIWYSRLEVSVTGCVERGVRVEDSL
jgi:hypothetical protein